MLENFIEMGTVYKIKHWNSVVMALESVNSECESVNVIDLETGEELYYYPEEMFILQEEFAEEYTQCKLPIINDKELNQELIHHLEKHCYDDFVELVRFDTNIHYDFLKIEYDEKFIKETSYYTTRVILENEYAFIVHEETRRIIEDGTGREDVAFTRDRISKRLVNTLYKEILK